MFILAVILIIMGTAYFATRDADEDIALIVSLICFLITLPIVVALLYLRLETRIDEKGVFTRFRPFGFTKKYFPWKDIEEIYVRTFDPVSEYGGWGIRGLGRNKKAYHVAGNSGIQIITKNQERFLIGTDEPEEAEKVLQSYRKTTTTS